MKAAVLESAGRIIIREVPDPVPGRGEVVVRVRAAGICGSDVPRVLSGTAHHYPLVLGHEFSGDVTAAGEDVRDISVGTRVAGAPLLPCFDCADCSKGLYAQCGNYSFIGSRVDGAFAEYVVMPARNAVPIDDNVSYIQGAFFEPATVGLHGLFLMNFTGGCDVAVIGGGNIGIFTMMWSKILGARSVTVFDIDERRLNRAAEFGADRTVNSSKPEAITPYRGTFPYVLETAGTPETILDTFEVAAAHASICCVGTPSRDFSFSWKHWELMNRKEFVLTGSWMSYSAPFPGKEWSMTAKCFSDGRLIADDRLIYSNITLEELPHAFDSYRQQGKVTGKIILSS